MTEALQRKARTRKQVVVFPRAKVLNHDVLTPTAKRLFAKCPQPQPAP